MQQLNQSFRKEEITIMNIKHVFIVGTMAFVITLSNNLTGCFISSSTIASPSKLSNLNNTTDSERDAFNDALGLAADESAYNALLEGKSLADIAEENQQDISRIVKLQVQQMKDQLALSLEQGNLSPQSYEEQVKELPAIIKESVYNRYRI